MNHLPCMYWYLLSTHPNCPLLIASQWLNDANLLFPLKAKTLTDLDYKFYYNKIQQQINVLLIIYTFLSVMKLLERITYHICQNQLLVFQTTKNVCVLLLYHYV